MRTSDSFDQTRSVLHRVAAHVLGRRRWDVSGRFGLRASPGGIATPAFGSDIECIRIAGTMLVRETGGLAALTPVPGSTLRALAKFAGSDIDTEFSCGKDTPPVGDPDEAVSLDALHLESIVRWFDLGARVLDLVLGALPPSAEPATAQLWPEHFDIGTNVALTSGDRVNLGCSPGDGFEARPYLYVGPWTASRPGDPSYWNAPFGAVLRADQILSVPNPLDSAVRFMRAGLSALDGRERSG